MKKEEWIKLATDEFKGKKVKEISWLTDEEKKQFDWDRSAPIIIFEDGSYLIASSDDEGNDAGALFSSSKKIPTLPVI